MAEFGLMCMFELPFITQILLGIYLTRFISFRLFALVRAMRLYSFSPLRRYSHSSLVSIDIFGLFFLIACVLHTVLFLSFGVSFRAVFHVVQFVSHFVVSLRSVSGLVIDNSFSNKEVCEVYVD